MSDVAKTGVTRRPLLASIAVVLGLGVGGGLVYEIPRLFARRYPRTKFDDLLDQVPDREGAAKLGHTAMAQIERHTDIFVPWAERAARDLRNGPGKGSIARAVEADIVEGRLVELEGWVLPISLVLVSIIAAEVQPAPPGGA